MSEIIYISKDIERCLGLLPSSFEYSIISNRTPFGESLAKEHVPIHLIAGETLLSSKALCEHEETETHLTQKKDPCILVFKNTPQIERICAQQGWTLLNPSAKKASEIEEKISQFDWLGQLQRSLPQTHIALLKDVSWEKNPFILQFNRAHTGSGTYLIEDAAELEGLQERFPERPVRMSQYINGQSYTLNVVVAKDAILFGNISYQITGIAPFTTEAFATIGNDWGFATNQLSQEEKNAMTQIAKNIGTKMQSEGWRGAFGIDVVVEEKSKQVYLIEINARQPASVSYESQLQALQRRRKQDITIFEAHIHALLDQELAHTKIISIDHGAQIIYRYPKDQSIREDVQREISNSLTSLNLNIIPYKTSKPGADYLRIQSKHTFIKEGFELNTLGEHIKKILIEKTNTKKQETSSL